jgi:hypothetical protein
MLYTNHNKQKLEIATQINHPNFGYFKILGFPRFGEVKPKYKISIG